MEHPNAKEKEDMFVGGIIFCKRKKIKLHEFIRHHVFSTATIIYAALYNFSFSGLYARFDIWLDNKLFVYDIYNYVLATKCHCTDKDDTSNLRSLPVRR